MMEREVRIKLSLGLVSVALLHAVLLAVVFTSLHGLENSSSNAAFPLPDASDGRPFGRAITATPQAELQLPAININARDELKQQSGPACVPCQPQRVQPVYRVPQTVQPVYRVPHTNDPAKAPSQTQVPKYQLALFLGTDQRSQTLLNWFRSDPKLQNLRQKTDFQIYTSSNTLYLSRYANVVPVELFPAVLFLKPDGGHIHAAGGNMIPKTAAELYADLERSFALAKSVENAPLPTETTGALRERGYNWDVAISPEMQLAPQDCPDGWCPEPATRPRILPGLFDRDDGRDRQAVLWAGGSEIVLVLAVVGLLGIGGLLLAVIVWRRLS